MREQVFLWDEQVVEKGKSGRSVSKILIIHQKSFIRS